MGGLIGWVGQASREQIEQGMRQMAAAMPRRDALRADLYAGEGIGLGRLHLGTLNPEPQPIWNEDRSLAIVMEGEVYDYADEKRRLMERGHRFPVGNDVEFVLHLFEEYGPGALLRLNGAFVAAIWDARHRRLTLFNDRFGLQALFYTQVGRRFLFASSTWPLLAHPDVQPRLDRVAVAEFLTFEFVLGERTLLEGISLLPPAACFVV
ncbi:MAG: asparagine synthetase B, partial [Chloroflexi bacterium]